MQCAPWQEPRNGTQTRDRAEEGEQYAGFDFAGAEVPDKSCCDESALRLEQRDQPACAAYFSEKETQSQLPVL